MGCVRNQQPISSLPHTPTHSHTDVHPPPVHTPIHTCTHTHLPMKYSAGWDGAECIHPLPRVLADIPGGETQASRTLSKVSNATLYIHMRVLSRARIDERAHNFVYASEVDLSVKWMQRHVCGNELPTVRCSVQETSNPSEVHCPLSVLFFWLFLPLFPPPSSLTLPLPSMFLFLPSLLSLILFLSTSLCPLPPHPGS